LKQHVSPRTSLYVNVTIVAVAAAAVVVGLTLDTRTTPHQPSPIAGKPPVPTNLPGPSGPQIEAAYRSWPKGSIDAMQQLGLKYHANAIVQYYRGLALLWAGYPGDAETALEAAKKLGRNTVIQGKADNLLHPNFFVPQSGPSYPVFIPTRPNALLTRGSRLQAQGHQVSAERLFQRAARLSPNDDEAQVAAAVGMFDEDNLTPSFSHLGPLTKRFPTSQTVRYYLGLLLAWTNQGTEAINQFEQTVKLGPNTALGKAAKRFLAGIRQAGTAAGSK
jgi:tetratricopeptide (TPR) repeat protein